MKLSSESAALPPLPLGGSLRVPLYSSFPPRFLDNTVMGFLWIFVFALPTDLHLSDTLSLTLPVGSLCILLGTLGVVKRRAIIAIPFGFWCLIAFVTWSTCTVVWAAYPDYIEEKLIKYWEFLPLCFVMTQFAYDRRGRMHLLNAYLTGCWLGVLGVFFHFATGHEFFTPAANELTSRYSFGTDANFLALALVIGAGIAWHHIYSECKRWKRLLSLLYLPAAFLAIGLTGSRGALIALLAAVLTFALFSDLRRRIATLAGTTAILALTLALPLSFTWRLSTTTQDVRYGTLDGRTTVWNEGLILFGEHPLCGLGAGATKGALPMVAHNTPLELLIEGGLISVGLFYGGLAHSIYRITSIASQERTLLIVICSALLVGTFALSWDAQCTTWFVYTLLSSAGSVRLRVQSATDFLGSVLKDAASTP
jgi:O-antigen ligase